MVTKTIPQATLDTPPSEATLMLRRFLRNRSAVVGAVIVLGFLLMALGSRWLTPYDPFAQDLSQRLLPPSGAHWFGTDDLGRDVLSRIIAGSPFSLVAGILSVGIALICGVTLGVVAGYLGKWVDELTMRGMDILMAFPTILLAILIVAIGIDQHVAGAMRALHVPEGAIKAFFTLFEPGLFNAMVAIGIVNIPIYARLVRASVLTIKTQEYIEAGHAMGASNPGIVLRHVLPNCMTPLIVQSTLGIAAAILETAGLSFLGLGVQPPTPEWGTMLNNARAFIRSAPWTVYFPGIAIMAVVLGFNLMGDGLRDLLDPKSRR